MKNIEKQVKIAFLMQDVLVIAAVAAVGIVCLLLSNGGWLNVIGWFIVLCALMMIPFYHHGYRIKGRNGVYRCKVVLMTMEGKQEILSFLEGKSDTLDLGRFRKGGALVEIYRRNGGPMLARYFDYAEHLAGNDYALHEVTPEQVAKLESAA